MIDIAIVLVGNPRRKLFHIHQTQRKVDIKKNIKERKRNEKIGRVFRFLIVFLCVRDFSTGSFVYYFNFTYERVLKSACLSVKKVCHTHIDQIDDKENDNQCHILIYIYIYIYTVYTHTLYFNI